jgi:hypothetical protein
MPDFSGFLKLAVAKAEARDGPETRRTKATNSAMAMVCAGVCKLVSFVEAYFVPIVEACIGRFAKWSKALHGAGLRTVLASAP